MRSFFDLVGFEYKKIFKRKSAIIALIVVTLITLASPVLALTGTNYVDGVNDENTYGAMVKDRGYARALSGRVIDKTLFSEVTEAYLNIPAVEHYNLTSEYEQYGRPYKEVTWMMYEVFGYSDLQSLKNLSFEEMQNFYSLRHQKMKEQIKALKISDKSKDKLIRLDSEIITPFVFEYTEGYQSFFVFMYTTGIFAAFTIAICLAPMFAGEYGTGASQLILSSKFGKNKLISAKLFTALSFCTIFSLFLIICTFFICAILFGVDGANAPFQLYRSFPANPYPLTMAQASLIFSVCILFAINLIGAVTAFLSSIFKSPFGVIIIVCLLLFVPMMLTVSEDNILLYNLFRLLPSNMMGVWSAFSYIPYEFFGLTVLPYVFLPAFAAISSAVTLPFTKRLFKNHQAV